MEHFDITPYLPGIPPAIVILLWFLYSKWDDFKSAGSGLWSAKVQDSQDRRNREYEVENIAIEIAREYNHWARQEFGEMQKEIGKLTRVVDGLAESVRTLAGAVDQLDRGLNKRHDGQ